MTICDRCGNKAAIPCRFSLDTYEHRKNRKVYTRYFSMGMDLCDACFKELKGESEKFQDMFLSGQDLVVEEEEQA